MHVLNVHNGEEDKDDEYNGVSFFSDIQNLDKSCRGKIYIKAFQCARIIFFDQLVI